MSDTDLSPSWHRLARRLVEADDTGVFPGRHSSRAEIAAETPIFHALTLGRPAGATRREPTAVSRIPVARHDALAEFRRDPLAAPIPEQAYATPPPAVPAPAVPAPAVPQPRGRRGEPDGTVVPARMLVRASGAHALPEQSAGGRHHRPVPVAQLAQRG